MIANSASSSSPIASSLIRRGAAMTNALAQLIRHTYHMCHRRRNPLQLIDIKESVYSYVRRFK
jgi:hypothetical protein